MKYSDVIKLKEQLAAFITEYYGERCSDYEPSCTCCEMWNHFHCMFDELEYMLEYISKKEI